MRHIHRDMDATYGTRRMMVELRELGFNVGRYKVRQLMKRLKLVAKRPKQHRYPMYGKPNSELTTRALRLAVTKRQPNKEVVFHSDQGGQYTSDAFQRCMRENNIVSSMSREGNCLDNAVTERFFRSLKSERVNYRRYQTRHQAIADIIDYIEPFYNQKRRHAKLGNISPVQYEQRNLKTA